MNQFEQLQRDARKSEREWKAFVKFERAWYAAMDYAGITPIEMRKLVKWALNH